MDDEQKWLEQMLSRCRSLLTLASEPRLVTLLEEMVREMEGRLAEIRAAAKH